MRMEPWIQIHAPINEILNDACHLLNHTYQNIHNTDENLLPAVEDETETFGTTNLEHAIANTKNLYPNIRIRIQMKMSLQGKPTHTAQQDSMKN